MWASRLCFEVELLATLSFVHRGVYSTHILFSLPPRNKLLRMLPCFYFIGKGHSFPKIGNFLPCFEVLLSKFPFLTSFFSYFFLFTPFLIFFSFPSLFCHSPLPPQGEGVCCVVYVLW